MRVLLDTHTFLWWLADDPQLSAVAGEVIAESASGVYISAATAWEITTKARIGKLVQHAGVADDIVRHITEQGFLSLDVTVVHAQRAGALPGPHRDPFDRMLIAQAQADNLILISNETIFDSYGVTRLW